MLIGCWNASSILIVSSTSNPKAWLYFLRTDIASGWSFLLFYLVPIMKCNSWINTFRFFKKPSFYKFLKHSVSLLYSFKKSLDSFRAGLYVSSYGLSWTISISFIWLKCFLWNSNMVLEKFFELSDSYLCVDDVFMCILPHIAVLSCA